MKIIKLRFGTNKKLNAKVRWFGNRSGEGLVRLENGDCVFVHWSSIAKNLKTKLSKPFRDEKKVWCVLFKDQKIVVDIFKDSHFIQVSAVY